MSPTPASGSHLAPPILVVGLGNGLLTDDGVGPAILAALRPRLTGRSDVVVREDPRGGLYLMERMVGYTRAIVVDAAMTGAAPGTIFELSTADLPTAHSASTHDATLPAALTLGRQAQATLPADDAIRLVAIEAADVMTFSEELTPAVAAALPRAVERVLALLSAAPEWGPPAGPTAPTANMETRSEP